MLSFACIRKKRYRFSDNFVTKTSGQLAPAVIEILRGILSLGSQLSLVTTFPFVMISGTAPLLLKRGDHQSPLHAEVRNGG